MGMDGRNSQPLPVVVIGAGAAGLQCAQELRQAGMEVLVIEATGHIGGRVRCFSEHQIAQLPDDGRINHSSWVKKHGEWGASDYQFEVGGEFVHGDESILASRCREGWGLRQLFTWAQGDGGPSDERTPDGGTGYYYCGRKKQLLCADDLGEDLDKLHNVLWSMAEDETASHPSLQSSSMREALEVLGVDPAVMGIAEAGYANTSGAPLDKLSFKRACFYEKCWIRDGDHDFRVEGGIQQFITELASGIQIRKNTPVKRISYTNRNAILELANGHQLQASHVVLTVPPPMLLPTLYPKEAIQFSPPLPPNKLEAAKGTKFAVAAKLIIKFNKRVWPEDCHGVICGDSFIPEMWMDQDPAPVGSLVGKPDNSPQDSLSPTSFYVTGFMMDDFATRVTSMPMETAVHCMLDQIAQMFETDAHTHYSGGLLVDWGQVPYIRGGYSYPSVAEPADARTQLSAPVVDTLFFAGEAATGGTDSFMTIQAALESGIRAAKEVNAALQRSRL